jgi:hypothetical protein
MTKELLALEKDRSELMQRLLKQEEAYTNQLRSLKLSHKETVATLSCQVNMLAGLLASRSGQQQQRPSAAPSSPTARGYSDNEIQRATDKLLAAHHRNEERTRAERGPGELATAVRAAERASGTPAAARHALSVPYRPSAAAATSVSPARTLAEQGLWAERELKLRSRSSGTPQRHTFVISSHR